MIIVHVYERAENEARAQFPDHAIRGDLYQKIKLLDDGYAPMTHGDFVTAGFMNFITEENA